MSVATIIVAAGSYSRLGEPKQLILIDGEPLLQRAIRCAEGAGASPVFVVLRAHRELIQNSPDFGAAEFVVNNGSEEGLASSIRAGVKSVQAGGASCGRPVADDVRSAAGDGRASASVDPDVVCTIGTDGDRVDLRRNTSDPGDFSAAGVGDLLALRGDIGARALLQKPAVACDLDCGEIDIDSPEDLAQLG